MKAVRRRPDWARTDVLLPLLAAYFAFSAYYVWQAWRRETPAIFTDELELTQISRAIAHTGHPARRGIPYHVTSIYPYFTAPAWWLHGTREAFDTIKYIGVLAMTAAIFPAYGIARTVLSQRWAVAAAVGAVAAPALSYSPILVEEPVAYPASTLALWLILRAALRPTWRSVVIALLAALVATGVRSQLVSLLAALALSLAIVGWRSERMRAWRVSWSRWDWVGAVALLVGAVVVINAIASSRSPEWEITTRLYKDRLWTYGTWAAGGLAVGLGVLPLVGGLASLWPPRREKIEPERTAFTIVAAATLASFGWYAAVKGAYVSTALGSYIVERNLIYLDPLLFVGTALLIARRGTRWWWAVASGGFGIYLVAHLPYRSGLDNYPYYESHGLAITAFANRIFHWPADTIRDVVIAIAIVALGAVLALRRVPARGRVAAATVAVLCGSTLLWNVTAETYAANGEYRFSRFLVSQFPRPFDQIDQATGGASTVMVGQQFGSNWNGYNLIEFWNRSITKVWSVDPTSHAPSPGPTLTPDLASPDGTMTPSPDTKYALAINGVALQAPVVPTRVVVPGQTLYRLDGRPLRLAFSQTGVESDGWVTAASSDAAASSAYNRFDAGAAGNAIAVVKLSRVGYAGRDVPGQVTIRLGTLVVGSDKQPALGRILEERHLTIHSCIDPDRLLCATGISMRNPGVPFRIEVTVTPTFVPHDFDSTSPERRHLAVQIAYSFTRL